MKSGNLTAEVGALSGPRPFGPLVVGGISRNSFLEGLGTSPCEIINTRPIYSERAQPSIFVFITYGAKLLNADQDWLRQRVFFLNHEGTFGNQEGMIT